MSAPDDTIEVQPRVVHCWTGKREWAEKTFGWGSDEHLATYSEDGDSRDGTCMLEDGHDGDHDFTPDDQIGVTFAPAEQP